MKGQVEKRCILCLDWLCSQTHQELGVLCSIGMRVKQMSWGEDLEAGKTRTSGNKRGDNPDRKYGKRNKGVSMVTLIFRDEVLRAHFARTFSQWKPWPRRMAGQANVLTQQSERAGSSS